VERYGINISNFDITALLNAAAENNDIINNLFPMRSDVVELPYSEALIGACLGRIGNYTTQADCLAFDGIGYDVIQYNFTAIHVAPLYQMLADEALVRQATGNADFKIQTTIHPLTITNTEQSMGSAIDPSPAWFLIILGFPFFAGSFATFVVEECAIQSNAFTDGCWRKTILILAFDLVVGLSKLSNSLLDHRHTNVPFFN
jgi:hypothetical protein